MVVRQQPASPDQIAHLDRVVRRLRDGYIDGRGDVAGRRARLDRRAEPLRPFAPADRPRAQRRRQPRAHLVQQRGDILLTLDAASDVGAQCGVVRAIEQHGVHEPADDVSNARVEQGRRDPQRDQHADVPRIAQRKLRRVNGANRRDAHQRRRDERNQRQRSLQEQIGEGEREVLIQDRKRERERCVMAEQLDRPRRVALVELAQMKRRHGEDGERGGPEGAARARLPARHRRQRHRQADEGVGQQPHPERRRERIADPGGSRVQRCRDGADRVGGVHDRALLAAGHARTLAVVAQHRLHDDGGKEAEG